ncbi:MAG: hypothetical protein PHS57_09420 [Alphaproteobacteria bacterium]|nr:hypothetical protein [Alphaproteobacteria bacterium]
MKGFLASLCVVLFGAVAARAQAAAPTGPAVEPKPVVEDRTVVTAPLPEGLAALSADLAITPVSMDTLPFVSRESVGVQDATSLGVSMWRGTRRPVAQFLMDQARPTASPVLNDLVLRVLETAAVPPEGTEEKGGNSLVASRVRALVRFGKANEALALARQADPTLVDGAMARMAVENAFLTGDVSGCRTPATLVKAYPKENWQKFLILCHLQANDRHAAQVALDVLRTESKANKDDLFLTVAEKNVLGDNRALPLKIDPQRADLLGLMQMAGFPVSRTLFAQAEPARARAFLRIPGQRDDQRLALAERAAESGMLSPEELGEVYASVSFPAAALAAPLVTTEKGSSLRALLYQASVAQPNAALKVALATRFVASSDAAFLNGAGALLWAMLGPIPVDETLAEKAVPLAHLYMLAGKPDVAKAWLEEARRTNHGAAERDALWPAFVLSGLEAGDGPAFSEAFDAWFEPKLKAADKQTLRKDLAPTLLILEAAGKPVPDTAWAKILAKSQLWEKEKASPLGIARLRHAAADARRAETVLWAARLAAESPSSLSVSLEIIRALRQVGLGDDAAVFARHGAALLAEAS